MQLICYLSNGYPTIEDAIKRCDVYVEAGADVIEVDLPARNPYLESAMIAGRMKAALEMCSDYQKYLDGIKCMIERHPNNRFLMVVYEDTIMEIGVKKYAVFCLECGLLDIIVVGSANKELKKILIGCGLKVSCYVQFSLPEEEIAEMEKSNGFLYLQAKPGKKVHPDHPTLASCIQALRQSGFGREIYCGVGVHTCEDVAMVKAAGGDGAFVGQAILQVDADRDQLTNVIRAFKQAAI